MKHGRPGSRKKNTSKFISLILRHKPEAIGIALDEHGWANVQELIDGVNRTGAHWLDMETLEEIVQTDEKQRYSFNEDHTLIRANQGHSIQVDVELEEKTPPDVLWHGTGEKYVKKVGSRHGRPVIYRIDCKRMSEDGCKFYLSANGVWLTVAVPVQYLEKLVGND